MSGKPVSTGSAVVTAAAPRHVLIVVSSYAPTMIADMHRARHLAWELSGFGWEAEILAPDVSYQAPFCVDPDSLPFFPPAGKATFVVSFLPRLFSRLGIGTIGWRALVPMFFAGNRIVRHVDVVYFSTTQFSLFLLGPLWRWWFGVPYVLDFHDPCVKENSARPIWMSFNLKYPVVRWLLKRIEAISTRQASALVAVSPQYLDLLSKRHAARRPEWTKPGRTAVIPFGALDHDLREAAANCQLRAPHRLETRIIYVGAGGPIMGRAFALLCKALATARNSDPKLLADIRIELYGTIFGWKQNGEYKDLAEIATRSGLQEIIYEDPGRISYRRSLELLSGADGTLVLGVDDAGYMPSKLIGYALSGKPLLSVLRREGPAYHMFRDNAELGEAIWFDAAGSMPVEAAAAVVTKFLAQCRQRQCFDRRAKLEPFLTPAMARRHAELFEACVRGS